MEKNLTKKELLTNLLNSAQDPFANTERILDIKRILSQSSSFDGVNHLKLCEAYLYPHDSPFPMNEEEARSQAKLAIQEGNHFGYYYLYLISQDAQEKRTCLEIASFYGYAKALIEIAKCYQNGFYFEKNLEKAYQYYAVAAAKGERLGYVGMVEVDAEIGDYEKQIEDYDKAVNAGFVIPGVIQ